MQLIKLRDMIKEDINDYIYWFCKDIDWQDFDAPWEKGYENESDVLNRYTSKYNQILLKNNDEFRSRFEIENFEGKHIGWVSSYWIDRENCKLAIGIDIPSTNERKQGYGTIALSLFVEYLKNKGFKEIYTQTWSGNYPMIKLAKKLDFIEIERIKNKRSVENEFYDALTFKKEL